MGFPVICVSSVFNPPFIGGIDRAHQPTSNATRSLFVPVFSGEILIEARAESASWLSGVQTLGLGFDVSKTIGTQTF
jgi:hypothetical protein